ncbi:DMT family transporter [Amorphus coralli]|uniref:DMT family transporter n=1 Tax=Amorphus coralli TaxID=340680 RepID=UPI00037F09C0|nr:DMT family transporter [Amorphus coralli]
MRSAPAAPLAASPAVAPAPDLKIILLLVVMCASWGLQQVAIKIALVDIPPLTQLAVRCAGGMVLVYAWARVRGTPIFRRDRSLLPGILSGSFFGIEFVLLYLALEHTEASRVTLFLYTAPFFVALGAIALLPGERLKALQWVGIGFSFAGVAVALGAPPPSASWSSIVADAVCVLAGALWAGQTLTVRKSVLRTVPFEKVLLYQLFMCFLYAAVFAVVRGEEPHWPVSGSAAFWLAYQIVWVVAVTYLVWFSLLSRYAAGPLQAATAMTPVFGVAAGILVLGEPLTPGFAVAALLVFIGLVLVNYRRRAPVAKAARRPT